MKARLLTQGGSDVKDLEALSSITPCFATSIFAYPIYHEQENLLIIENSFEKLMPMQISYGIDFEKVLANSQ